MQDVQLLSLRTQCTEGAGSINRGEPWLWFVVWGYVLQHFLSAKTVICYTENPVLWKKGEDSL